MTEWRKPLGTPIKDLDWPKDGETESQDGGSARALAGGVAEAGAEAGVGTGDAVRGAANDNPETGWAGKGAEMLGLSGEVTKDAFLEYWRRTSKAPHPNPHPALTHRPTPCFEPTSTPIHHAGQRCLYQRNGGQ